MWLVVTILDRIVLLWQKSGRQKETNQMYSEVQERLVYLHQCWGYSPLQRLSPEYSEAWPYIPLASLSPIYGIHRLSFWVFILLYSVGSWLMQQDYRIQNMVRVGWASEITCGQGRMIKREVSLLILPTLDSQSALSKLRKLHDKGTLLLHGGYGMMIILTTSCWMGASNGKGM